MRRLRCWLIDVLDRRDDRPQGGWLNGLPEAFGALDAAGNVEVIGYKGEWYEPIRVSLRSRLRNRLVGIENRVIDEVGHRG